MAEVRDDLLGLEFAIDGLGNTSISNSVNGFVIYLKVDNKTQRSRKINLLKSTYVTNQREQFEQDTWLSGYLTGETTLKPDSFAKAGLVFYKPKLKTISDNDVIYISLQLVQEGVELNLSFQKVGNSWLLVNQEKADIEIKLSPKQLEKELIKRIERLESFEERLSVSIQNMGLKVEMNGDWLMVFFELHSSNGTTIKDWLTIECVLYNHQGIIIDKGIKNISPENFFGFQAIEIFFQKEKIANQVSKIRLYPVKQ